MKMLDGGQFDAAISQANLKPRLRRELRPKFGEVDDWEEREFVAITDRSGNNGVLWIELDGRVYVVPYQLSRGIVDRASGRARPVICDLCYTQQLGTLAARISFTASAAGNSRGLLVCADLSCSQHVRGKTTASLRSRAQLREDITPEARVGRLRRKLRELVEVLAV